MQLDYRHIETINAQLSQVCYLLDGSESEPGLLRQLGGDSEHPGLIDQAYRAGTRLEELSESVKHQVVGDLEKILAFLSEGDQQEHLVESLRHRLAAMVDTETQRAMRKHLDSLDATAQEVLKAARWAGDQLQEVTTRLSDFDEALDDKFEMVKQRSEAFGEAVSDQQGVLQERLELLIERLQALKEIDTDKIQMELQGAAEDTARSLVNSWAQEHHRGLRTLLDEHREASKKELQQLLDGQSVLLNDGVAKSRRMVAKAIEASTYEQTLNQLTENSAALKSENMQLKADLQAAERKRGASAKGVGGSVSLPIVVGGFVVSGLLSGAVVAGALLYVPAFL